VSQEPFPATSAMGTWDEEGTALGNEPHFGQPWVQGTCWQCGGDGLGGLPELGLLICWCWFPAGRGWGWAMPGAHRAALQ